VLILNAIHVNAIPTQELVMDLVQSKRAVIPASFVPLSYEIG
jgi:hypothetical protein